GRLFEIHRSPRPRAAERSHSLDATTGRDLAGGRNLVLLRPRPGVTRRVGPKGHRMSTATLTVSIEVTQPEFSNPVEVPGFRVEGGDGGEFEGEADTPLKLPPGTWRVIVDADEVTPFEDEVTLEAGEEASLEIEVASADGLLEVDLPEGVTASQVRID